MNTRSVMHAIEPDREFAATVSDAGYIDLDFSAPPPVLVTRVLCTGLRDAGGKPIPEEEIWQWTLARRLQALLQLVQALSDAPLELATRCCRCQENLSLQCGLQQFMQPPGAESVILDSPQGEALHVRLPTGRDQQRWLEGNWNAERIARNLIHNADALVDRQLGKPLLDAIAGALEQADPLTALVLDTACPACATAQSVPVNLEDSLLRRLQRHVTRLLHKVHRLASHYHWTEDVILSLPRARLEFYLACIEKGVAR